MPLSNYVVDVLSYPNLISSESKHACVATMNGIWKNCGDNGLVMSSDLAIYGDNADTARSAEFTGGAGSIAILLQDTGRLLDIYDVQGSSAALTHDFYKPYSRHGTDVITKVYPTVFGAYSNITNIERVGLAYRDLISKVDNFSLEMVDGLVLHIPYPGITKYNIAMLSLIDRMEAGNLQSLETIIRLDELFELAHTYFAEQKFGGIKLLEKECKIILKREMKSQQYQLIYGKHEDSLHFIAQTGNLYTGSSPLGMMSLLEHQSFEPDQLILWGGYGSGNQAMFMIARTTPWTTILAHRWQTQTKLDRRLELSAEQYTVLKTEGSKPFDEIWKTDLAKLARPADAYYLAMIREHRIRSYQLFSKCQDDIVSFLHTENILELSQNISQEVVAD